MIVRSVSAMCLFLIRKKYKCESVSGSESDGMCPPYIVNVDDDDNPGRVGMKKLPALIPVIAHMT